MTVTTENIEREFPRWIRTGRVPKFSDFGREFHDDYRFWGIGGMEGRWAVIPKFGFALPCHEAVQSLKKLSPLVEVGAGLGTWAAILAKNGADIVATDLSPRTGYVFRAGVYHPLRFMSAQDAVRRYRDRNVLMVWPCFNEEWATETARQIDPGRRLALISEGMEGCCGSDSLFELLGTRFRYLKSVRIPCWTGIHDRLDIYERVVRPPAPPRPSIWD